MNYMLKISLLMLVSAASLMAADAGKIAFISGGAEVSRAGKWQKLTLGAAVNETEEVRTGKTGTLIIALRSGAALKLKPETTLTVAAADSKTVIELQGGSVFARVDKRRAGQTFEIRAQTTVAAVRGTEFFFAYGKKEKTKSDLWLCVNEGRVNVTDGTTQSDVDVNAGEGIVVPTQKQIPKPKAYAWTKKLNWNMDASKGGVEDKSSLKSAYSDLMKQNYD
ncbi:MAG: FecR domain-containing protein [Nitrospira sp.]|nr:FecR domain-containing protein [Nitrospira sp.]